MVSCYKIILSFATSCALAPHIYYSQDHNLLSLECPLHMEVRAYGQLHRTASGSRCDSLKTRFPPTLTKQAVGTQLYFRHGSCDALLIVCITVCLSLGAGALIRYSALAIAWYCHLTAFQLWAFDLPLDQFSALSKPISQSQPLTWVSGNREGHWQYHWTQIICQCKH